MPIRSCVSKCIAHGFCSLSQDPGLKVMLTMVPASMATAVGTQFNVSLARRRLLQAAAPAAAPNTTKSTTNPTTGWLYMSDYESESPDPWLSDPAAAVTPPNYSFDSLTATATTNAIQDQLGNLSTVNSFTGESAQPYVYACAFHHACLMGEDRVMPELHGNLLPRHMG